MIDRPLSALLTSILVVACVAAGCNDSSTRPTETSPYAPLSSPENCVANLIVAMTTRDSTGYAALFADEFRFSFSPIDIFGPEVPPDWPLEDELAAAGSLFHSADVQRITLAFRARVSDPQPLPDADSCRISLTEVRLSVFTLHGSEMMEFRVPNGHAVLILRRYRGETAGDGGPVWRIERWLDEPIVITAGDGGKSEGTSWGRIKLYYRQNP